LFKSDKIVMRNNSVFVGNISNVLYIILCHYNLIKFQCRSYFIQSST